MDVTDFVEDVAAVMSAQALPDHSCHWYVTPVGASTVAVKVTLAPEAGKSGDDLTEMMMGFHEIANGAESTVTPEVNVTLTLKNLVAAVEDETAFVAVVEDEPKLAHAPFVHSCHW